MSEFTNSSISDVKKPEQEAPSGFSFDNIHRNAMIEQKIWTHEQDNNLIKSIEEELDSYWKKALLDPLPVESSLLERVYE